MKIRSILLCGLLTLAFSVNASVVSNDAAFDLFKATVLGDKTTVVFGSNGTVLAKAPATISTAAEGLSIARKIPIAAGTQVLDVVATQTVSRAAIGGMIKTAASVAFAATGGTIGLIGIAALVALPYVSDYLLKNGVKVNPAGSASAPFETVDPSAMNTCRVFGNGSLPFDGSSCEAAANAFFQSPLGGNQPDAVVVTCYEAECIWSSSGTKNPDTGVITPNGMLYHLAVFPITPSSSNPSGAPLSPDQLSSIIANSTVPVPPEILPELVKVGAPVVLPDGSPDVKLSGPTESAPFNTVQSTKVTPEGTTTQEDECVRHLVYAGPNVDIKDLCHTTFTAPDGSKSSTDTTKKVDPKQAINDGLVNDKARPNPATLPASAAEPSKPLCAEFPEILACQKLTDPGTGASGIPKSNKNISFDIEDVFGSGSCPSDKTLTINGQVLTVVDWTSYCGYITLYVRPLLILLASYAAFMFLVPNKI